MTDINHSYDLEPVGEGDMDLAAKFRGGMEKKKGVPLPQKEKDAEQHAEKSGAERDATYQKILQKVQTTPIVHHDDDVKKDAQDVYQQQDADAQVQHLVDLAMAKGIVHAVRVAQHLENAYVLDSLHDRLLADELHNALVAKGLITEE
ncbi:MAG TPA: hypothetical protein VJL38_01610 [Patescibacteria group bacterium]|nr:hypothetical protein [Patescibacteria group bacterium]